MAGLRYKNVILMSRKQKTGVPVAASLKLKILNDSPKVEEEPMSQDIQSNNKRIAKNTLLLYTRMLILMVISLFTSRINLRSLGIDDYGIYNVVGGLVATFHLISGALGVAISRDITYELGRGDERQLNKVFSMAINIQLFISIIVLLLAETVGLWFLNYKMVIPDDRLVAANWTFQCSLLTFIVNLISVPYNACIIAHEKMSAFAYISILEAALKLVVAYSVFITPFDKLITFAVLLTSVSIIQRLIYGIYCSRKFTECKYRYTDDKVLFKHMLGFAGWTMFGNAAVVGYTQGLNILLNLFFGPAVNAARGIAVQIQTAVLNFCTNFQMALNPQITKNYASGNIERMHQLMFASSKYSFFLLFFLSLPIILETDFILKIWLGEYPDNTSQFLRLVLIVIMIDAISNPMTVGAQAYGKIKSYQLCVGGLQLMILPIAYLVLKLGSAPESVFVVHISVALIALVVRLKYMQKMIGLSIRAFTKQVIVRIIGVTLLAAIIPTYICSNLADTVGNFFIVSILSVLCTIIAILIIGLSGGERKLVINKLRSKYDKSLLVE